MNKIFVFAMFLFVGGCSLGGNQQNTESLLSGDNQENIGTNDTGGPKFVPGAPKSTGDQVLSGQTQDEPKPKIDVSNIKHQKDFEYGFWTDGENMYFSGYILSGVKADGFKILLENDMGLNRPEYYLMDNNGFYRIYPYTIGVDINKISSSIDFKKLSVFDKDAVLFKDDKDIYYIDSDGKGKYSLVGFGADLSTFKKNKYYYIDKNHIYNMFGVITGADTKTFEFVGPTQPTEEFGGVFKDKNAVYYYNPFIEGDGGYISKLDGISPEGLVILSDHVIKDKNNVMILGFRGGNWTNLTGADAQTFKRMTGFENQTGASFYQDKNAGYFGPGDESTLSIINSNAIDIIKNGEDLGGGYYIYKKAIYYLGYDYTEFVKVDADYQTFKYDDKKNKATDKNHERVDGYIK